MYLPKFKFLKDVAKPGAFTNPDGSSFAGGLIKDFLGRAFKGSSPAGLDAKKDQLIDLDKLTEADKQFVSQINKPSSKDYSKGYFQDFLLKTLEMKKLLKLKEVVIEKKKMLISYIEEF